MDTKLKEQFYEFLNKSTEFHHLPDVDTLLNNVETTEVFYYDGITLYLHNTEVMLHSDYFTPSDFDDKSYTLDSGHLYDMFKLSLDSEYLFRNYSAQLEHKFWKEKSSYIKEKSGQKCIKCGSGKNLQVHHIEYHKGCLAWEYEDEYLECLCGSCHMKEHNKNASGNINNLERTDLLMVQTYFEIINTKAELQKRLRDQAVNRLIAFGALVSCNANVIIFKSSSAKLKDYLAGKYPEFVICSKSSIKFRMNVLRKIEKCN